MSSVKGGQVQSSSGSASTPGSVVPARTCVMCKQLRADQEVSKHCDCYYHQDCIRLFVNNQQLASCAICCKPFTNCRISKSRRSFRNFLYTTEVCATLLGSLLVLFYVVYFLLVVFTLYSIVHASDYPRSVQLWILIPGGIYVALCIFFTFIGCLLLRQQYRVWSEQNYTLVMSSNFH